MGVTQVKGKAVGDKTLTDADIDLSASAFVTPLTTSDSIVVSNGTTIKRTLLTTLISYLASVFTNKTVAETIQNTWDFYQVGIKKVTSSSAITSGYVGLLAKTDGLYQNFSGVDKKIGLDKTLTVTQIAHGLIVGTAIKLSGTTWVKAKADSAANAGTAGIVDSVIDANTFTHVSGGLVPGSYTSGESYFLSTATAGAMMVNPGTWTVGQVCEFLGTGTPNGLLVEIDMGIEIGEDIYNDKYVTGASLDANAKLIITRSASQANIEVQFGTMAKLNYWSGTSANLPAAGSRSTTTIYMVEE